MKSPLLKRVVEGFALTSLLLSGYIVLELIGGAVQ